ncbi:hypothetical protein BLNAU_24173 [Blattamonas nauphoetae]|uniref:Uncharacterized protein n=1 Tax=Blattamonas nauphoetae TaxID=2049346 RepID=A0ABQ9WN42_9EUKA|nr:hypothetical protein BLNAU_24173 [Blattamonas nauphoetae]
MDVENKGIIVVKELTFTESINSCSYTDVDCPDLHERGAAIRIGNVSCHSQPAPISDEKSDIKWRSLLSLWRKYLIPKRLITMIGFI